MKNHKRAQVMVLKRKKGEGRPAQIESSSGRETVIPTRTAIPKGTDCFAADESYRSDIRDLNRLYLVMGREMSRQDPDLAYRVLGLPESVQRILAGLTLTQIEELLVHEHCTQFTVRFNETYWTRLAEGAQNADYAPANKLFAAALSLGGK